MAAWLFDGITARRHAVRVTRDADGLEIVSQDAAGQGQAVLHWPFDRIRAYAREARDNLLTLGNLDYPLLRLQDSEAALELALADRLSVLQAAGRADGVLLRHYRNWFIGMLLGLLVLWTWALPLIGGLAAMLVPLRWDRVIGEASYRDFLDMYDLDDQSMCSGPAGMAALQTILERLQAVEGWPHPVRLEVWDYPLDNAFAFPGARILLFTDRRGDLEGADILAGTLAHEYAHILNRDSLDGVVTDAVLDMTVEMMLGQDLAGGILSADLVELLSLSRSRGTEERADRDAQVMLKAAGLPVSAMAFSFDPLWMGLWDRNERMDLYSTHPHSTDRARSFLKADEGSLDQDANLVGVNAAIAGICD